MAGGSERVALVTGGGRGIGRSVVLALVRRGYRVAFCYRSDTVAADACVEAATEAGGDVTAVKADVTIAADRTRLVDAVRDRMGAIGVLVNNAGTTEDGVAFRMKEAWDRVVDLDLTAPFRLVQLVIRGMMSGGWGRIVTIGSIASRLGFPGQANYTAAKAGVEGMTRSLAQEYGRRGVTVNTVSPGFIETDLTRDASDLARTYVENYSALGRYVTADAVAEVVAFLVSDEAWAVTGQTINVDGGLVKL